MPFVRRSHELWREIEGRTGAELLYQVGGLVLGPASGGFLELTRATAMQYGIEHRDLSERELAAAYPMFTLPSGTEAYFEPEAGFVRPEEAVAAQLSLAQAAGAQLRLGETVQSWDGRPGRRQCHHGRWV